MDDRSDATASATRRVSLRRGAVLALVVSVVLALLGGAAEEQGWDLLAGVVAVLLAPFVIAGLLLATFGPLWLVLHYLVLRPRRKRRAAHRRPDYWTSAGSGSRDVASQPAAPAAEHRRAFQDESAHDPIGEWEPPYPNVIRFLDDDEEEEAGPDRDFDLEGEISNARYWAEDPSDPDGMPFEFRPPPGWPDPGRAWLPDPSWEPDRRWPAVEEDWELWARTAPRPRALPRDGYGPKPAWTTHVDDFDEARVREAASTPAGRRRLKADADEIREQLLQRRRLYLAERADPNYASGRRSLWHPLEYTYDRALDRGLRLIDAALELAKEAPADTSELVEAWGKMCQGLDDIADADDERRAQDENELEGALELEVGWATVAAWRHSGHVPAETAWQEAEKLAAESLRAYGFADAHVTESGSDAGLDVRGKAIAAQVKYTDKPMGRPVIQQLSGAAGGRVTAFFSRAGYTAQAVEEAERAGMALFRIALPSRVTPVNTIATRMMRS